MTLFTAAHRKTVLSFDLPGNLPPLAFWPCIPSAIIAACVVFTSDITINWLLFALFACLSLRILTPSLKHRSTANSYLYMAPDMSAPLPLPLNRGPN